MRMSSLQAKHGRNVVCTLAKGTGEIQTMQTIGNTLGLAVQQARAGAYIPMEWKIVHPSHSVAQYRGITWC